MRNRGAEALDASAEAVAHIRANAARNALANVEAREANVFDELRRLEKAGARYDTIVLDPPLRAVIEGIQPDRLPFKVDRVVINLDRRPDRRSPDGDRALIGSVLG